MNPLLKLIINGKNYVQHLIINHQVFYLMIILMICNKECIDKIVYTYTHLIVDYFSFVYTGELK